MGLGTKIREVLNGDKDNLGSRRRKTTPGAYPESTTDIPRTGTNETWRTGQTDYNKPLAEANEDSNGDSGDYGEYTHTRAEDKQLDNDAVGTVPEHKEEGLAPATEASKVTPTKSTKLSKEKKRQNPYWGDFTQPDANDFAARDRYMANRVSKDSSMLAEKGNDEYSLNTPKTIEPPNLGAGAGLDANHATNGNGLARNGTITSTTNPMRQNMNQVEVPIGTVNNGRPVLVDDEAAMATSMVASQVSQPSDQLEMGVNYEAEDGMGYGKSSYPPHDGYGMGHGVGTNDYDNYPMVQRMGTINGKGTLNGNPGSPKQDHQARNYAMDGFTNREENGAVHPNGMSYAVQPIKQAVPARERTSPLSGSESGSAGLGKPADSEHYGPGHAGARVLHRCQHCGNDNDITRYFSKDVVYRLS